MLRPHFQAHEIMVLIDKPLRNFIQMSNSSCRIVKCMTELNEFIIKFAPNSIIKEQSLVKYIVDNSRSELT